MVSQLGFVQLREDKFTPILKLFAEGLHIGAKSLEGSLRVFACDRRAKSYFRFQALFHGVDYREKFFLGEDGIADFPEPDEKSLSKFGIRQERSGKITRMAPPAHAAESPAHAIGL